MRAHYDLHTHSTASDGTLSATELVRRAHTRGVDVLALTDHDVTAGLDEAYTAAGELGLLLVPGVEISVTWNHQTVHIVGLNIDPANEALQKGLAGLRAVRDARAEEIGKSLERHGIAGAYAGAGAYARGPILSRTHFARFLLEQGYARDMQQVFKHFLSHGKPGDVPVAWATLQEAVAWIRASGGQAVIAHPARYRLSLPRLRLLLEEFKHCGGTGIEVLSGSQGHDDCLAMTSYARQFGFFASCGSDYHGPENPWVDLGGLPDLPSGCVPVWKQWQ